MDYFSTPQVAAILGVSLGRVRQLAANRGIQPIMRISRMALWSPSQVEALRPGPPGTPGHRKRPPAKREAP